MDASTWLVAVEGTLRLWEQDGNEQQARGRINLVTDPVGDGGCVIYAQGYRIPIPKTGCRLEQTKVKSKNSTGRVLVLYFDEGSRIERIQFTATRAGSKLAS